MAHGKHDLPHDMELSEFPPTGKAFKVPAAGGVLKAWGTTVPSSVPGYAPGCIFTDYDASAGLQVWINEGSATSCTFVRIEAGSLELVDDEYVQFGTSSDIRVLWDGNKLISAPPTGLWAGAPSPLDPDPYKAITLFDDFLTGVDTGTRWITADDSATGTNTYSDILGGSISILTAAANDDYHAMHSTSQCFNLLGANELWFEARFRVAEAATSQSTWWFGLTDMATHGATTGGMQAVAAGPLTNYDGVLIYKIEGAMAIDVETSNDSSQDVETGLATFVTNTWTRVGFHVSAAATTAVCTAYFDVAAGSGALTAHSTTMNLTRAGLQEMYCVFGIKSGGSVETLEVDYIKCVQLR